MYVVVSEGGNGAWLDTLMKTSQYRNIQVLDPELLRKAEEGTTQELLKDIDAELRKSGTTCTQIERTPQDRVHLISVAIGLCSSRSHGPKKVCK